MKPAHIYLFTDHSRQWWRFRTFWGPQENRTPGSLSGSGYRSLLEARDEAISAVPYSYYPVLKPSKSVPAPREAA